MLQPQTPSVLDNKKKLASNEPFGKPAIKE